MLCQVAEALVFLYGHSISYKGLNCAIIMDEDGIDETKFSVKPGFVN